VSGSELNLQSLWEMGEMVIMGHLASCQGVGQDVGHSDLKWDIAAKTGRVF